MTTTLPAGWKPISSAPKDGTEILAWRADCGQFIAKYTSADAFPMTQDELDAMDEETLFAKDWFTQWPDAPRLDGSEAPTLWQPLPAEPCPTCNDQGAVGNILNAEPCPDCTPPASAQDDAKDVEAAARAIWAIRREHEDRCDMELEDMGAHHPVWEEARVAVAAITAKVGAPVAGDARALLDHPLLREVLGYIEDAGPADVWGAAQSWMALRDAASQQQEG